MDKKDDRRCKWSDEAVHMLVSIWSHDQVQNSLNTVTRNQHIWESIARYMQRKGHDVTGVQCKTRIKNMLVSYNEALKKKDPNVIAPYFSIFKRVDMTKKKKGVKSTTVNNIKALESDSDENIDDKLNPSSTQSEDGDTSQQLEDYSIEYLETNDQSIPNSLSFHVQRLEQSITAALSNLSNTITKAIEAQTKTFENMLSAEGERFNGLMAEERKNREKLEKLLNMILSTSDASHVHSIIENVKTDSCS